MPSSSFKPWTLKRIIKKAADVNLNTAIALSKSLKDEEKAKKRKTKEKYLIPYHLMKQPEEIQEILNSRLCDVILQPFKLYLTNVNKSKIYRIWDKTSQYWDLKPGDLSYDNINMSELMEYYVPSLMPPLSPSKVRMGDKMMSMSMIEGREKSFLFTKKKDEPEIELSVSHHGFSRYEYDYSAIQKDDSIQLFPECTSQTLSSFSTVKSNGNESVLINMSSTSRSGHSESVVIDMPSTSRSEDRKIEQESNNILEIHRFMKMFNNCKHSDFCVLLKSGNILFLHKFVLSSWLCNEEMLKESQHFILDIDDEVVLKVFKHLYSDGKFNIDDIIDSEDCRKLCKMFGLDMMIKSDEIVSKTSVDIVSSIEYQSPLVSANMHDDQLNEECRLLKPSIEIVCIPKSPLITSSKPNLLNEELPLKEEDLELKTFDDPGFLPHPDAFPDQYVQSTPKVPCCQITDRISNLNIENISYHSKTCNTSLDEDLFDSVSHVSFSADIDKSRDIKSLENVEKNSDLKASENLETNCEIDNFSSNISEITKNSNEPNLELNILSLDSADKSPVCILPQTVKKDKDNIISILYNDKEQCGNDLSFEFLSKNDSVKENAKNEQNCFLVSESINVECLYDNHNISWVNFSNKPVSQVISATIEDIPIEDTQVSEIVSNEIEYPELSEENINQMFNNNIIIDPIRTTKVFECIDLCSPLKEINNNLFCDIDNETSLVSSPKNLSSVFKPDVENSPLPLYQRLGLNINKLSVNILKDKAKEDIIEHIRIEPEKTKKSMPKRKSNEIITSDAPKLPRLSKSKSDASQNKKFQDSTMTSNDSANSGIIKPGSKRNTKATKENMKLKSKSGTGNDTEKLPKLTKPLKEKSVSKRKQENIPINPSDCETPKKSKIEFNPFTPMPDYRTMPIEALQNQCSVYGLKQKLSKTKSIKVLEEIFRHTHQIDMGFDLNSSSSSDSSNSSIPNSIGNVSSDLVDEDKLQDDLNDSTELFLLLKTIYLRDILTYKPIDIKQVLAELKANGVNTTLKKLNDFLDNQCIICTNKDQLYNRPMKASKMIL